MLLLFSQWSPVCIGAAPSIVAYGYKWNFGTVPTCLSSKRCRRCLGWCLGSGWLVSLSLHHSYFKKANISLKSHFENGILVKYNNFCLNWTMYYCPVFNLLFTGQCNWQCYGLFYGWCRFNFSAQKTTSRRILVFAGKYNQFWWCSPATRQQDIPVRARPLQWIHQIIRGLRNKK